MTRSLPELSDARGWIPWIRLAAAPFALLEVAIERGNYPPRHEPWAWALSCVFALGAGVFLLLSRRKGPHGGLELAALVFDTAVVSGYVVLYAFEPGSPVRQLLVLVVIEAALRYGRPGAAWALTSAPALGLFEWRQSDRLDLPFDPGHVVFPVALQLLVGLIVGALARASAR